ncbi:hypothetical protein [Wenzhouxiangella sp. XN24]|uniref:hypothetical protein n=1 Tax=Wenzhouxiangella sp. XN24 TaxID=2713569 RepID=UPI001F10B8E9|nr:hypothetical protein [Wenzhouxiangella sp. XN24]
MSSGSTAPRNRGIPLPHAGPTAWTRFLAHFLFVLAAWTIFIKYVFPIAFAIAEGEAPTRWVYWDLWPVAHAWLGWALLFRPPWTRKLAIGMAVTEIAIIATLLSLFLADPEWSIWRTNWFVNKVFVLACFVLVLTTALLQPEQFKGRAVSPVEGAP